MKGKQYLLTAVAVLSLIALFVFGKIDTQKSTFSHKDASVISFNITDYIQNAKGKLSISQQEFLNKKENSIKRGDINIQQVHEYETLATFWKDSTMLLPPYLYYLAESAKLDNSEKNLTFAARLILDSMRVEENVPLKSWEAETAVSLFKKAIEIDPNNVDLKVDLGSCYVYGKGMIGDATETMKGIQQLLQVVRNDSANMKAQMVLGIGGVISRQFPKAVERLEKVVKSQPGNLEAVSWLADAYAGKGDKGPAIKWYEYSKKLVNDKKYSKEVDDRIKALNSEH